jgi:hypothetical protein
MSRLIIALLGSCAIATVAAAEPVDPNQPQNPASSSGGTDWAAAKAAAEAQTAAYTAQTAAANAQKAWIEARQSASLARIGTVAGQTAITGAVTAGTDTAKAEGLLLVTRATLAAAEPIHADLASQLASAPGREVLILTDTNQLSAADGVLFDVQVEAVATGLRTASDLYAAASAADHIDSRRNDDGGLRMAPVALAGALLDSAAKIGSYFQTDYTFGAVTVDPSPGLVAAAVVNVFRRAGSNQTFIIPANYTATDAAPVLAALRPLQQAYVGVVGQQAAAKARAVALHASEADGAAAAAARYDMADAGAGRAIAAYEAFLTSLTAPVTDKEPLIVRVIRQKRIQDKLSTGPLVLLLNGSHAAAYYTKKNLWTFLGGPPLYTMGGVSLTYTLFDPASGQILRAGAIAKHGGYRSVRQVERLFR